MRDLARRLAFYVVAAWGALTINFLIPRLMPGDPESTVLARFQGQLSPHALHSLRALFGFSHASLGSQYLSYLGNLLRGDLGTSLTYYPTSVASVIGSSLPWTVVLVGLATVLSFVIGTLLGVLTGWKRGTWLEALLPITTFFSSVPYFWLALLALLVLGVEVRVFPISGGYGDNTSVGLTWSFISSAITHGILPAVTIIVSSLAAWLVKMRNMMISTSRRDYVLMAEAKGLRPRRVVFGYAARNAVLPSIAGFAMSLGFVVGGAILVEIVFSYPGIGYVLYQAVTNDDYPLMQGIFLVITLCVLIANFAADIVYVVLDPRTRQGRSGS